MSISKAIWIGILAVNGPVLILIYGIMFGGMFLAEKGVLPSHFFLLSVLLGPLIGWIYWSITIPIWRIWAFSRVEDHDSLSLKAVNAMLIWPEGHWCELTEFRTVKQSKRLKELRKAYRKRKYPKRRKKK